MFFIDKSGYWSPTKSTLVAVPERANISVNSISARSEKRSGILVTICSIAMASMMTHVVSGGRLVKPSTPSSRSFERAALLVFASDPSDVARDHGNRPSS